MISFHGEQKLKDQLISNLEKGTLVYGDYWDSFKHCGCALGCAMNQTRENALHYIGVHQQFESAFGFPRMFANLFETVFERQKYLVQEAEHLHAQHTPWASFFHAGASEAARARLLDFVRAIPVGVDLTETLADWRAPLIFQDFRKYEEDYAIVMRDLAALAPKAQPEFQTSGAVDAVTFSPCEPALA